VTPETVEQSASQLPPPDNSKPLWNRRAVILGSVILLLMIVVGVAVPLSLKGDGDDMSDDVRLTDSPSPSEPLKTFPPCVPLPATLSPTRSERFITLREVVIPISGEALLFDDSTVQFRALEWLVYEDLKEVTLDNSSLQMLRERYVLALLYFATGGDQWTVNYNFMSPLHVCQWSDPDIGGGITCDNANVIVELRLGKKVGRAQRGIVMIVPGDLTALLSLPQ
jgi:hypothetical protein